MGLFSKLFGRDETDDAKELREYEQSRAAETIPTGDGCSVFHVTDVVHISERGTVASGTVASGTFSVGDMIKITSGSGGSFETKIIGIEKFKMLRKKVSEGERAGFLLIEIPKNAVKKGDTITKL